MGVRARRLRRPDFTRVASIHCLVDRGRRIDRFAVAPHPLVPAFAKQPVSLLDHRLALGPHFRQLGGQDVGHRARLAELFRQSLAIAARKGRRVILRGHPHIQRTEIGSAIRSELRRLERRPTPVFFMPASALQAGAVEQPLRNVLPNRVAAIQTDRIGGLDFHGPLAAAAGDAHYVTLNFGKTSPPHLGPGRIGARVFEYRFPIFSRKGRLLSRRGGVPPTGGFSGQFFRLLWGRHAPARGSIGHSELEHKENKSRVRPSGRGEKIVLLGWPRCRNQAGWIVLNPALVLEFSAMAPRANWKGFLRLSLVTCPVALYPATSESEKVSFNQLNRKTGHRIKYAKVDADTGEEVANEDIVKGYKVDTDTFIEVTKEELENVALESTRTIEIDEFVDRSEIDPRYLIRPYYLVPDGKVGHDAFAVIRETIREMNKVAIGRVVLTNREHIIALDPLGKGLMGTLLRYPYEVRSADEYFDDIQDVKVTKDMLDLARHIVTQKAGHFEPDKFEDQYETALIDLINQKRAGKPITAKARPRGENVVDLMDALRKSIGGGAAAATEAPKKPARKARKAAAGQKEMLMPIAGKKPAKEAPAKKPAAKPQRKSA